MFLFLGFGSQKQANGKCANQRLSLSLFKTRVFFVDHVQLAFSPNDLAICAAFFDRCPYFHFMLLFAFNVWRSALRFQRYLFVPEYYSSPCQIVWAHLHPHFITRQNADIVHSHFPRNGRQNFMPIFQLYFEHSIG
jgi:hypothetical protein